MFNSMRCASIAGIALSSCLFGITTTNDPSQYTSTAGSVFAGVALLNIAGGDTCSASLIAPNFLLTAAHCVNAAGSAQNLMATFTLANGGPATYSVVNYFTDGTLLPDLSNDIALVELSSTVAGITPYSLGTSTLGETITLAGYGDTGEGTADLGSYGNFHAGLNTVDGYWDGVTQTNAVNGTVYTLPYSGDALAFDFDSATGNGTLGGGAVSGSAPQNEAMICYGDSGGPAFAGNAFDGGSLTIVGVNDFLTLPNPNDSSATPQCTNNESAAGYAGFGDLAGDNNVATHLAWIDATIAEADSAPEPATWTLIAIGAGLSGLALRRRPR
jgi:hypothetical protein